ncbi:hypothetical protein MAPG_06803 [Magnaporthiopsis poae ATCC 64411]|uniref:Uncharacterized protein n=1 Tax=Magnaporthiopsis poae (strain ATCC 64411 / 73-15) TaxID=644358 RepID=A0A0C4E310_MAGP6|nr:hypothetical protein MAPG_06803 [Magnaporthiopsis poae ATCC 64411]
MMRGSSPRRLERKPHRLCMHYIYHRHRRKKRSLPRHMPASLPAFSSGHYQPSLPRCFRRKCLLSQGRSPKDGQPCGPQTYIFRHRPALTPGDAPPPRPPPPLSAPQHLHVVCLVRPPSDPVDLSTTHRGGGRPDPAAAIGRLALDLIHLSLPPFSFRWRACVCVCVCVCVCALCVGVWPFQHGRFCFLFLFGAGPARPETSFNSLVFYYYYFFLSIFFFSSLSSRLAACNPRQPLLQPLPGSRFQLDPLGFLCPKSCVASGRARGLRVLKAARREDRFYRKQSSRCMFLLPVV